MHYEDLRQIHDDYDHVYLAPHLDDAVLSCGGMIARHSANGARVLIVTICTAVPPPEGPFSALAQEFHQQWGMTAEQAMLARLHEDSLAVERIGADSLWAGMLDALYRQPAAYRSSAMLVGDPAPNDQLEPDLIQFISTLRSRTPRATIYAPLGVGRHVDHQLTAAAALATTDAPMAFYEDIPYVLTPGALDQQLARLRARFVSSTIDIDQTLSRKIGAIAAYTSQITPLFGSVENMERQITSYAESLVPEHGTYGERLWLRIS